MLSDEVLKAVIEGIVYVAPEPVTLEGILKVLEGEERDRVKAKLDELTAEYEQNVHGIQIRQVANGYKFSTKAEHHEILRKYVKSLKAPIRLSKPALETLAVIAYRQPVTMPEIEEIRGVDTGGVIHTLLEKKLVVTAGRKNVVGRPILYRTSKDFLVHFGLRNVSELPSLKEFEELARRALGGEAVGEETLTPDAAPANAQLPLAAPDETSSTAASKAETTTEEAAPVAEPEGTMEASVPADGAPGAEPATADSEAAAAPVATEEPAPVPGPSSDVPPEGESAPTADQSAPAAAPESEAAASASAEAAAATAELPPEPSLPVADEPEEAPATETAAAVTETSGEEQGGVEPTVPPDESTAEANEAAPPAPSLEAPASPVGEEPAAAESPAEAEAAPAEIAETTDTADTHAGQAAGVESAPAASTETETPTAKESPDAEATSAGAPLPAAEEASAAGTESTPHAPEEKQG